MKMFNYQPPPRSTSQELSINTSVEHESFQNLNNLWLNGLILSNSEEATLQSMLKIAILEPCIVHLWNQTIPIFTLKELMNSQSSKVLKLVAAFFTLDGGRKATLNEILEASPTVVDYSIRCHLLEIDNHDFSKIGRENEIQRLTLQFVTDQMEIPIFSSIFKEKCCTTF